MPNGAANVVPVNAVFTIDIRAEQDPVRLAAAADGLREMQAIAARRNVQLDINQTHDAASVPCAPWLQAQFAAAVTALGMPLRFLPSGAGHDAMAVAALTDVAMLFVRCGNGGISHHPDETMTAEDAEIAADVFSHVVEHFQPQASDFLFLDRDDTTDPMGRIDNKVIGAEFVLLRFRHLASSDMCPRDGHKGPQGGQGHPRSVFDHV